MLPFREVDMAIYSLHHSPIGRSTQAREFTASAHIRYISRPGAQPRIMASRMPEKPSLAAKWLEQEERGDRKNARVVDKVMLALPRELDGEQRAQLVRSFAERVTGGRASWMAAIHEQAKDAKNPHCHLVVRDRDVETGRRVFQTSEKDSTERMRALWEECANTALLEAGHEDRIDRRTLVEQGIERDATIHEGPKAQEMDAKGTRPQSQSRERRNGAGARTRSRTVHYPNFDKGRSRPAFNRNLRSSARESEADLWQQVDAQERTEELDQHRQIHRPASTASLQEQRKAWLSSGRKRKAGQGRSADRELEWD